MQIYFVFAADYVRIGRKGQTIARMLDEDARMQSARKDKEAWTYNHKGNKRPCRAKHRR